MYKVIVVDDEDIIVNGLVKLMPWEKYRCQVVGSAADGEQALALIREQKPDVMFTDIRMPKMDGLALIGAVKSEYPAMEITILSGHPQFTYAQKAISLGVSSYILKPSKMDELEQALEKMVTSLDDFYKKIGSGDGKTPEPTEENEASSNFVVHNALKYMEENYRQKLSLTDVAQGVYVSQWHLSKLIAKVTGQSFNDLLNGIRIKEAKKLLEDPALRIGEVSERVGFLDVAHFSRVFKKVENCSANDYRNSYLYKKQH